MGYVQSSNLVSTLHQANKLQHGLMSHPSSCTVKAVSAYFVNGTMPELGTECEPDLPVFEYIESLEVS
jgi:TAP-like protein